MTDAVLVTGATGFIGTHLVTAIRAQGREVVLGDMAALINKRDNKYFIAPSDQSQKVRVNNELVAGQRELAVGDMIEVAKVKMAFSFSD